MIEIMIGDCRERLAAIPSDSIHLVLTSPPYYGLRDYGTATWFGGSPDCTHALVNNPDPKNPRSASQNGSCRKGEQITRRVCRCGAARLDSQIGLETTPADYIAGMVEVFREVYRTLRPDGSLWLNMGDSYAGKGSWSPQQGAQFADRARGNEKICRSSRFDGAGLKIKDLMGMPWQLALALRDDGVADLQAVATIERVRAEIVEAYEDSPPPDRVLAVLESLDREYREAKGSSWYLRQDVIWAKPNPMPESVQDRCTKAHEYLFLLTKGPQYFFDAEAIAEPAIYGPDSGKHEAPKGYFAGTRPGAKDSRRDNYVEGSFRAIRPNKNKRSVWTVPSDGFDLEMCEACETIYEKTEHRDLRRETIRDEAGEIVERRVYCGCGRHDAWLSHFATFPAALIEPCILASTSAKGCCAGCGAPWERILERKAMKIARSAKTHEKGQTRAAGRMVEPASAKTVGWRPTCECPDQPVIPATVLDPFGGAGTSGLVADRLQRGGILIELNPLYAALARYRIDHERGPMLDRMEAAE